MDLSPHPPGFKKAHSFHNFFLLLQKKKKKKKESTFPLAFAWSGGKKFPRAVPQLALYSPGGHRTGKLTSGPRAVTWPASPSRPRKHFVSLSSSPFFFTVIHPLSLLPPGACGSNGERGLHSGLRKTVPGERSSTGQQPHRTGWQCAATRRPCGLPGPESTQVSK